MSGSGKDGRVEGGGMGDGVDDLEEFCLLELCFWTLVVVFVRQ